MCSPVAIAAGSILGKRAIREVRVMTVRQTRELEEKANDAIRLNLISGTTQRRSGRACEGGEAAFDVGEGVFDACTIHRDSLVEFVPQRMESEFGRSERCDDGACVTSDVAEVGDEFVRCVGNVEDVTDHGAVFVIVRSRGDGADDVDDRSL